MELVDGTRNTMPCRFDRSLLRQHSTSKRYRSCCLCIQIYFSYVLCVFSSSIIAIAMVQFFRTFNQQWLVLIGGGLLFIIVGSSIYRNGVLRMDENGHERFWSLTCKRDRWKRCKRTARENHVFESHLSINMLPQCFTSLDITSSSEANAQLQSHANRSRHLILLPIDAEQMLNDHLHPDSATVVDIHGNQQQPLSISQAIHVATEIHTSTTTNNEFESCVDNIVESAINSGLMEHDDISSSDQLQLMSQEQTSPDSNSDDDNENINNEAPPCYDDVITDGGLYRTL